MKNSKPINIFSKDRVFMLGLLLVGFVFVFVFAAMYYMQNREATLLLTFEGNGKGRMFSGKVVKGMSILDALITSSNAGQIEFKYSVGADGKVIIFGLDGYDTEVSDKKMVFYLNRKRIESESIKFAVVNPGDNIEVRLE